MTAVRCFKLFTSPTLAANAFPYVTWKLSRTYVRVAERRWDEYLWQEDERLREEKDERKRKYNVTYSNEVYLMSFILSKFIQHFIDTSVTGYVFSWLHHPVVGFQPKASFHCLTVLLWELTEIFFVQIQVTQEDMEAYRMKKVHFDDPMKEFLKS